MLSSTSQGQSSLALPLSQSAPAHTPFFKGTAILLANSFSVVLSYLLQMFVMTINLHVAGNWQDQSLVAALGLSIILIHALGGTVAQGFNQGYVTFVGRAYGNKNHQLIRQYNLKQIISLISCFLALAVLMFFSSEILLLLQQDSSLAKISQDYGLLLLPAFFLYYIFDFLRCYLNSIEVYTPITVIMVLTGVFHAALSLYFQDWEFWCPIGCTFLTYLVGVFLQIMYIYLMIPFSGFTLKSSLKGFWSFFKENLYMAMPQFLDVFSFQINSLIVGSFKMNQMTAAHVSVSNLISTLYSFSFGLGGVACTFSSNYIGQNQPNKIKVLYKQAICLSIMWAIIFFTVLTVPVTKDFIFNFYTNNSETTTYMGQAVDVYKWFFLVDCIQASTSSFLKSFGFGESLMWSYIIVYYVVGVTLSFTFSIWLDLQIRGVWLSFGASLLSICLYIQFKLWRTDWRKQVQERFDEIDNQKKLQS